MSSLIEEKTFNSLNSQISGGSRSSILLSHVDFKSVEDDNDLMSSRTLQTKYNVLTNGDNMNTKDMVIKMNGQNGMTANINNLMNGNTSDNTDGIPVPKHVLFPHEKVILEWKENRPIGSGLTNLGNTCFLNSVLQCLSYCAPLVNYLLHTNDHNINKCNNSNNFCMVCEMVRHIRQIRNHSGEAIKPINICRRLKSIAKHFTFGRQEDAHEFLRYVIDNMWKSCLSNSEFQTQKLDPLSKETTAINQIFGGYHRSQVQCLQCKAKSNTYDYFMDFMLDIKNVSSLEKALDKFVAPEILQNEESYKCARCKRKVLARKQFTVFKAPNVATFQFKRFDYNRMFGGKITKQISYPEKLDLRPYMSENKGSPILYKLNSVLVHLGPTCNSGHYFCYVRNSNNSWYLMDDSRVIQTNQNNALNQGQAYVLFYVRLDTDFHRPTPIKNFISQTTPNGIKLSNISSPELIRNQKLNNFGSIGLDFGGTQNIRKISSGNNGLKPMMKTSQSDANRHTQSSERKQSTYETNNNQMKCLVPYASDSSDDETPKNTNQLNGSLNSNCDKNLNISKLSANDLNSNQSQKICPKVEKVENISPNVKTSSNQSIPSSKLTINQKSLTNHTSEANCVPLAPITLKVKVKATTSSWQVVESALRSPSIASNSSTNSVNSTTEWNVSDCKPECNGKPSKHKHKNKQNRYLSTANGVVTQVSKDKIPQNRQLLDEPNREPKTSRSLDICETQSHSNKNESNCLVSEANPVLASNNESITSKLKDNSFATNYKSDAFDRKSISSHRSSSDSLRSEKRKSKDRDRSHSKSVHSDESTGSAHKHEKRKHKSIESETKDERNSFKSKHKKKKKKMKKQKHKKKDRSSDSDSDSDDSQLQWVERTKETVEKERHSDSNKSVPIKQWNENVRDLAKKRPLPNDNIPNGVHKNELNNQNSDTVNELLKNNRGFGDKVNSWNGGPSHLESSMNEDKRANNDTNDDYDDEYDRGRTKKMKTNHRKDKYYDSSYNPFQKYSEKYQFNGSFGGYHSKSDFNRKFKTNHNNNHKHWKSYHNRGDSERRH